MKDKTILIFGVCLIAIALIRPNISSLIKPSTNVNVDTIDLFVPDDTIQSTLKPIVDALRDGSNDRKIDGKNLASLYNDMSVLISIDDEDEIIKTTEDIKQANAMSGLMLKLNIKDKYPNLKEECTKYVIEYLGDDNITLDKDHRNRAVLAFKHLAWACYEGSK